MNLLGINVSIEIFFLLKKKRESNAQYKLTLQLELSLQGEKVLKEYSQIN